MSRPLDYLAGSRLMTSCVETQTLIAVVGPDAEPYLICPDPVTLPASIVEWVETLGTIVHDSVRCQVYWVTDELAGRLHGEACFCGSGRALGECHAKTATR